MRKIELHWETRNEYVLTGNELKSLEEKHRRDLERRKKEEEEKKKLIGAQISDLQNHGGISQNFVSKAPINSYKIGLTRDEGLSKKSNNNINKPVSGQNMFLNKNNNL